MISIFNLLRIRMSERRGGGLFLLSLFFLLLVAYHQREATAAEPVPGGQPIDVNSTKYQLLFEELQEKHHFEPAQLAAMFQGQTISARVLELMDYPWEAQPYYKYAKLFLTPDNIATGKEMLRRHQELLARIEATFGVDREIVVAIWGIETRYGVNQGNFDVFNSLNTLFAAYPRRSTFFRKQLIEFLLLCRENGVDPTTVQGSYAGAFGQTQFIPTSFQAYAVSFDGDKKRDVWNSVPDILASIANYLKQYRWSLNGPIYAELGTELKDQRLIDAYLQGRSGRVSWVLVRDTQRADLPPVVGAQDQLAIVGLELPPESGTKMRYVAGYQNFIAITEWNHSNRYAMAVTELAQAFRE